MKIINSSLFLTIYFYSVLGISVSLTFLGNGKINNYGPVIYMLTGFPVLFGLFYMHFYQFSLQLKKTYPKLFEKHIRNYSIFKSESINILLLFNNLDFKEMESNELKDKYKLTLKTFRLTILSFILIIPIAIGLIMFKIK